LHVHEGVGVDGWAGRNPCMMMTTAMPEGTVTSLEVSSWHCPSFPFSSTGETLDPVNGSGGGAATSFPSLEASSWWFVGSSVHLLESMSAPT
jgi:hypothetical protein